MHNSNKQKHLEMIQIIINRMGSNSFVFKGWSITIITGISAFAAKDSRLELILIPAVATLLFWAVDAYYLMLERQFRDLYKNTAGKDEQDIDFLMIISPSFSKWFLTLWRPILAVFYITILIMLSVLFMLLGGYTIEIHHAT